MKFTLSQSKWLTVSVLVILLDQVTKYIALSNLNYLEPLSVGPFFNFTLVYNSGAAFSLLSNLGPYKLIFLSGIAITASIFILIFLFRLKSNRYWMSGSLSLILGGAVGNLIDRIQYGIVVDFIDLHIKGLHWPAFNIADIAISTGAIMLMIEIIWSKDNKL